MEKVYYIKEHDQMIVCFEDRFGNNIGYWVSAGKIAFRKLLDHNPKKIGWVYVGEL